MPVVNASECRILLRTEVVVRERVCDSRNANLMKPPDQGKRDPMRHLGGGRRGGLRPRELCFKRDFPHRTSNILMIRFMIILTVKARLQVVPTGALGADAASWFQNCPIFGEGGVRPCKEAALTLIAAGQLKLKGLSISQVLRRSRE